MEAQRTGIIYKYTSPTNKIYIGQTIDEKQRISQHKTDSRNKLDKFHTALREQGWDNFKYEVIFTTKGTKEAVQQILNEKEWEYINQFDSAYFGLNSNTGNKKTKNYNGKTEAQLISEAFTAYKLYNNESTPENIKDDLRQQYFEAKKYKYVCYYTYSVFTDKITLPDNLKAK